MSYPVKQKKLLHALLFSVPAVLLRMLCNGEQMNDIHSSRPQHHIGFYIKVVKVWQCVKPAKHFFPIASIKVSVLKTILKCHQLTAGEECMLKNVCFFSSPAASASTYLKIFHAVHD